MADNGIGSVIKNRREELGLSLEDVARQIGVNRSTIYHWEEGHNINSIKRSHIYLLSKVLYIPLEALLGLEGGETENAEVVKARLKVIDSLNSVKSKEDLEQVEKYIKVFIINK